MMLLKLDFHATTLQAEDLLLVSIANIMPNFANKNIPQGREI
ncbi:hypothetical protein Ga0466249_000746 [Sporomusaceae bacterium BoRhaA]|nr:hypothetical protein [Pelorhabdus rhamnosifermentans]